MKTWILDLKSEQHKEHPVSACIGYFDGIHIGHQALLQEAERIAKEHQYQSALITFDIDPWAIVRQVSKDDLRHITTMEQRQKKAERLRIENFIILHFTKEMADLAPAAFIDLLEDKLDLRGLVCGFDFHFASRGSGDADFIRNRRELITSVVAPVCDEQGKISSTRISGCIENGRMEDVTRMLGNPYTIDGRIIHGSHVGTSLGFPTANISFSPEYILPKPGVYAGIAETGGQRFRAMANLGHNPTLNYKENLSLEAFLLDCEENLYNDDISLSFLHYLRPEQKFSSKEELIAQLKQDEKDTRRIEL